MQNQINAKINIDMPCPIGVQKVGVFFSKQQKTQQLRIKNEQLEQQMKLILLQFNEKKTYLKNLQSRNNNKQNLFEILSVENTMIQKQLQTQEQTLNEQQQMYKELSEQESYYRQQTKLMQEQLYENAKKCQEQKNLLDRYIEEFKVEKTLRHAPDSIGNVCKKMQKQIQLQERNIRIHEQKLEGKKNYLKLIDKKIEKRERNNAKVVQENLSPKKKQIKIYQKYLSSEIKKKQLFKHDATQTHNDKQTKQNKCKNSLKAKQKMKQFQMLTRKKNAILKNAKI